MRGRMRAGWLGRGRGLGACLGLRVPMQFCLSSSAVPPSGSPVPKGVNGTSVGLQYGLSKLQGQQYMHLGPRGPRPGWRARSGSGSFRPHPSGWSSLVSRWVTTGGTGRPLLASPQYPGRGLPGDRGGRCCPESDYTCRPPLPPPYLLVGSAHAPGTTTRQYRSRHPSPRAVPNWGGPRWRVSVCWACGPPGRTAQARAPPSAMATVAGFASHGSRFALIRGSPGVYPCTATWGGIPSLMRPGPQDVGP